MQTLIRINLAILLSLMTLGVLGGLLLVGLDYMEARKTVRFFETTTCATLLKDLKSQDAAKAQTYGEAFQKTADKDIAWVDEDLYNSKTTFNQLLRGCFAQPKHTLRDIMVKKLSNGVAAQVTDLYNTIEGEMKPAAPMAPELYVQPQTVSATAPQGQVSATQVTTEAAQPNAK